MKNVIIVYNGVPEFIRVYKLSVSDEDFEKIKKCSGSYVNMSKLSKEHSEACDWLSVFLEGKSPAYSEHEKENKLEPISCGEDCTVVVTGFLF